MMSKPRLLKNAVLEKTIGSLPPSRRRIHQPHRRSLLLQHRSPVRRQSQSETLPAAAAAAAAALAPPPPPRALNLTATSSPLSSST